MSDDESFHFLRAKNRLEFDSSSSEDEAVVSLHTAPTTCWEPLCNLVYIDDFNSIEKLRISDAKSHITTARRSELLFEEVQTLAASVGMKVNQGKTQLLCVHANRDSEVSSYIRAGNGEICSGVTLKILGFTFSNKPDATHHVTQVIEKFYTRLWTLRFLKSGGMTKKSLTVIYNSVIRPFV